MGIQWGVEEKISPMGWNEALTSQANGATNRIAVGARIRYVTIFCFRLKFFGALPRRLRRRDGVQDHDVGLTAVRAFERPAHTSYP